ncbi:hypothetical protein M9Y10_031621 [Tritrichomonas musculus]|uniref:Uncharacterized protein n=1 Tax=Tritrichomonas musculus TaxID=1915356 RepID=A0ABR2H294_9EUKA
MKNELKQLEANILMYCFQSKQIDSILEEQVVTNNKHKLADLFGLLKRLHDGNEASCFKHAISIFKCCFRVDQNWIFSLNHLHVL